MLKIMFFNSHQLQYGRVPGEFLAYRVSNKSGIAGLIIDQSFTLPRSQASSNFYSDWAKEFKTGESLEWGCCTWCTSVIYFHIHGHVNSVDPFAGVGCLCTLESQRLFCLWSGISHTSCSLPWCEILPLEDRLWSTVYEISDISNIKIPVALYENRHTPYKNFRSCHAWPNEMYLQKQGEKTNIVLNYYYVFFSCIRTDASQESTLTIPVGNVTMNTELSYEFGVKELNLSSPQQDGVL